MKKKYLTIKKVIVFILWLSNFSSTLTNPSAAEFLQQAQTYKNAGKNKEACIAYQQALSCDPRCFEALFQLGNEFFYRDHGDEAILHYKKALEIKPEIPQVHFNLGVVFEHQNALDEAIECFKNATTFDPTYTKAYSHLCNLLKKQKKDSERREILSKLVHLEPQNSDHLRDLAELCTHQEHYQEACDYLKKAHALQPENSTIAFDVSLAYTRLGLVDDALRIYKKILDKNPGYLQAIYNSGYVLKMAGRIDEALEKYQQVLAIDPTYDAAQFALGHALLNKGDFDAGWKQHERYLKQSGKNSDKLRQFISENTVAGKIIFLRPEGGLGDTLQFIRYAQLLKYMGAYVVVSAQKPLLPLLSRCDYIDKLIENKLEIPKYDDHGTLMSMPAIFGSNEQTIPRNIPYLAPDPNLVELWGNQLKTDTNFKIGICWQADVFNDSSRLPVARRGIPLHHFYPLAQLKGISLYSLQKKEGLEQLDSLPENVTLHLFDENFDEEHGSFMDTAAVMQHLDLIITVDTATAHLAGALGRPVWVLLPYSTDWRWIAGRKDSPWYPTMHVFKQPQPFDWESVMSDVCWHLATLLHEKTIGNQK